MEGWRVVDEILPKLKNHILLKNVIQHRNFEIYYIFNRRVPMWPQSGTLLFGSCHGIARFLVDDSEI